MKLYLFREVRDGFLARRGGHHPLAILLALVVLHSAVASQAFGQNQAATAETEVPRPNPTGADPKPENATTAILAAFDKYEVVGLGAAHGNKDLDDFILNLLRNPALPGKVNDIAVECGNALYQPILDRYIAGDDVPLSEAQLSWRNTTQAMCGTSAFYEELFPLVRRINQQLPGEKRLRVLACDPAIDWQKLQSRSDLPVVNRDASIASVLKKEVLSRHRKALLLFGTFHLFHMTLIPSAVQLYEKEYPGLTLVIGDHEGFGSWTPIAKYNGEFEARMASWPVPSLVQHLQGTWLGDLLDMTYSPGAIRVKSRHGPDGKLVQEVLPVVVKGYSKMVDAYLYLAPRDLLLREADADISSDRDYTAELHRRAMLLGQEDLEKLLPSIFGSQPFLYDPNMVQKLAEAHCQSHTSPPCVIGQGVDVESPE